MDDREKLGIIRSIHAELARHFAGDSELNANYDGRGGVIVNGASYTENEFDQLLHLMIKYSELEASRLARLRDRARELMSILGAGEE